jgi:hypothetical protein
MFLSSIHTNIIFTNHKITKEDPIEKLTGTCHVCCVSLPFARRDGIINVNWLLS